MSAGHRGSLGLSKNLGCKVKECIGKGDRTTDVGVPAGKVWETKCRRFSSHVTLPDTQLQIEQTGLLLPREDTAEALASTLGWKAEVRRTCSSGLP